MEKRSALGRKVSNFARTHIAPRTTLHLEDRFPLDIWQAMGAEGLLGMSVSERYGGMGATSPDLAEALYTLVKEGHSFGLGLSFLVHQMVAHYVIETWADANQKKRYLPHLARGTMTASLAVSEPEKGAHPKHLTSSAVRDKEGYRLSGEKTYLTNGPIADLFVVIAVSKIALERKSYSAFMVPRDCPGLEILPPLNIPFFKPAPHGAIRFTHLKVPLEALLGPQDSAYDNIVLPVRRIENTLMMAALAGLLDKQICLLAGALRPQGNEVAGEDACLTLGQLVSMLDAAKAIARTGAEMLDNSPACPELISLPLFFRKLTTDIQMAVTRLQRNEQRENTELLRFLTKEIHAITRLGRTAAESRQLKIGASFLETNAGASPMSWH